MLEILVETENGVRHLRPSAEELAGLVRRIGGHGDQFLVLQRVPDLPDVFAQVVHEAGGGYWVEHCDNVTGLWNSRVDELEAAVAALIGWARQEADWDAGLEWELFENPNPRHGPPQLDLDDDERGALEQRIREELVGGYVTRVELAELAEEYLVTGDRRPVSRAQAIMLADWMWLERVAEQEHWRGETDPDRLARAFAALEEAGITARENFACCRSCGQSEIDAEAGPDARGYVYFHSQCTGSAAAGQGLMLLYGGFDGSSETTTAIGHEIVAALETAGLRSEWDRAPGAIISVTPLDWRRRLIG